MAANDNSPFVGRNLALERVATPVKYRMTALNSAILLAIACLGWAIEVLLVSTGLLALGAILVGIFTGLMLPCVAWFMGVKFNSRNTNTFLAQAAIGMVPVLDLIPAYVIGTVMIIRNSRKEDRAKAAREARKAEEARQESEQRLAIIMMRRRVEEDALRAANDAGEEGLREAA